MSRRFRLLAALILVTSAGLVLPPDSAAQRHPPSGAVARHGTAVPRTHHSGGYYRPGGSYYRPGGSYYRPYYYRPYYYRPYYSRYYYPYYPYYYAPYYYPYYVFGVGFGFGWGSLGLSYGYGNPYPYPYPSGYGAPYGSAAPYGYAQPYAGDPSGYGASNSVQMQQPAPAPQSATAESGSFGTLSMRVTPPEATILIDGQVWDRPQGQDRFSIDLVEGTHRVEVRQQGYTPYTRVVQIRGGGTLTLNVSLPTGGGGSQVQQLAVRRTVPLR